jgi:hypothetical protein
MGVRSALIEKSSGLPKNTSEVIPAPEQTRMAVGVIVLRSPLAEEVIEELKSLAYAVALLVVEERPTTSFDEKEALGLAMTIVLELIPAEPGELLWHGP